MQNKSRTLRITFRGIEYIVDVEVWKNDTTVYIEYANIDDDIDEVELKTLTKYLIGEGFIEVGELG